MQTEVCRLSVCWRSTNWSCPFANRLNTLNGLAYLWLHCNYVTICSNVATGNLPCCMLYVYAACPCCTSMLLVHSACPCLYAACPFLHAACYCYMSRMHVHAACSYCMFMLLVHAACLWDMSRLHVLAARPYYMFMLHASSSCSCLLLEHAAWTCCVNMNVEMHICFVLINNAKNLQFLAFSSKFLQMFTYFYY